MAVVMARRDESICEMLIETPWWVGVITAAFLYALLRYLLPGLMDDGAMTGFLAELPRLFALPSAALALLASAVSAVRSLLNRKRTGDQGSAAPSGSRTCPRCDSALIIRRASRGENAGSNFWGCSSFPKCRYTEDIPR